MSEPKKRNPQDLTLRNLHALQKRVDALEVAVRLLVQGKPSKVVLP